MTTRTEATDDCMGLINTALDGLTLTIHWPRDAKERPNADQMWVRATMQHFDEGQASLGKHSGLCHYQATGKVFAEVFTPAGLSLPETEDPAILLRNAFCSSPTTHGVVLRNATARESGLDGGWCKTVVSVDFEYDEVR